MSTTLARGISLFLFLFCALTAQAAFYPNAADTNAVPPYIANTNAPGLVAIGTNTVFYGTWTSGSQPNNAWSFLNNSGDPVFESRSDGAGSANGPEIHLFDGSYGRGFTMRLIHDHDFVGSPEILEENYGAMAIGWGRGQSVGAFQPLGRNLQLGVGRNNHPWIQPQDEIVPMDAGLQTNLFSGMPYQLAAHATNSALVEINIGSADTTGFLYPAMQPIAFDTNANGSHCWFASFETRLTDNIHWDYTNALPTKAFEIIFGTNVFDRGGFRAFGNSHIYGRTTISNVPLLTASSTMAIKPLGGSNIFEIYNTNGLLLVEVVTNNASYDHTWFTYSNAWLTATNTRKTNIRQRATYEVDFKFANSNAFMQVTIEDATGAGNNIGRTNVWICSGAGGLTMTNHYTFRVPPLGVVSLTNQGGANADISAAVLTLE